MMPISLVVPRAFPNVYADCRTTVEQLLWMCRYGNLDASVAEQKSRAVTLPLDDFIESDQLAAKGKKTKTKGRARKVKDISAADLETALMRN